MKDQTSVDGFPVSSPAGEHAVAVPDIPDLPGNVPVMPPSPEPRGDVQEVRQHRQQQSADQCDPEEPQVFSHQCKLHDATPCALAPCWPRTTSLNTSSSVRSSTATCSTRPVARSISTCAGSKS